MKRLNYILSLFLLGCAGIVHAQPPTAVQLISKIDLGPQYPMWDNEPIQLMGYTHLIGAPIVLPSPTLVFNEGDSVDLTLWNLSQGPPHSIHLHGLDVDQANDGVPALSFDVEHDTTGVYHFRAPHAGTYLYHCHVVSPVHVQAGMYGMVIVKPTDGSNTTWNGGFPYDSEKAWLTSEIDTFWHSDDVLNHDHNDTIMVHPVPMTFNPLYFLVNGISEQQLTDSSTAIYTSENEEIYLRLANIGYCGNTIIFPAGMNARIVSSDGRPLPQVETTDTVVLFPGERFGVLLNASSQFTDSIAIQYTSMNSGVVKSTQYVPVQVEGVYGVKDHAEEMLQFVVYPNPATGAVHCSFELKERKELLVELMDVNGKLIYTERAVYNAGTNILEINTSNVPTGIYMLRLNSNTSTQSRRIVVQR